MIDMASTIVPRSDQWNSDDFIAGARTVTITKVSANPSSSEQPISINFDGDEGKPYKPCKGMRRVLVAIWGRDATAYVGRSLTLYRDPTVTWGGMAVGGIRISHASHLDDTMTLALTASKQSRKPFIVRPLEVEKAKPKKALSDIDQYALEVLAHSKESEPDVLAKWWAETSDRRLAMNIPADRLAKMESAVQKALEPANDVSAD